MTTPHKPGQGRRATGVLYPVKITVPVSEEQRGWLDSQSSDEHITVSELIRRLIEDKRGAK